MWLFIKDLKNTLMNKSFFNIRLSLTTVVLIILIHTSYAQDNVPETLITFEQALTLAHNNNHSIKQAQYLQQEKKQNAAASKGLYFPQIGITANYMVMSDPLHLDLTPVKDAITPLYSTLANYGNFSGVINPSTGTPLPDSYSTQAVRGKLQNGLTEIESANWDKVIQEKQFGVVAANFQWPLYAGGKIRAANAVAKIEKNEASEISRQKEGELVSELVERYYGLCLARQAVLVRQDVYNGMEKHLNDAQKMQLQGLIANAEVLHAKVYESEANRELSKANRMVEILNQSLLNTLSQEESSNLIPASNLFYLDSIESLEYFITLGKAKNPQLLQVESKRQLSEQNHKVMLSNYLPSIAAQGMYDIVNKDLSPYTPTWMVGIGMKWDLFDGASRLHKVKAATLKMNQVEEFQLKATSDVETIIKKLYQELQMYREELTELETAKSFAEEYVSVREKAFKADMANATEVVDAYMALSKVSIERLQAMHGYDVSLAKLLQYSGIPEQFIDYQQRNTVKTEKYSKQ
jgi:outer membrane protein TolC